MVFAPLLGPLAHLARSVSLDDSSVSFIALLAGMTGGFRLTGWLTRLKMKKVKIEADRRHGPRDPR